MRYSRTGTFSKLATRFNLGWYFIQQVRYCPLRTGGWVEFYNGQNLLRVTKVIC